MLQQIRSSLQGIIARVIIGLITIPFVLWGIDAFFLDSGNPDVAKVNGKAISELELNQQVYRQRQQMLARMGDRIEASQIDEAMLRGPVLEQLVQQRMLESVAESSDLLISEQVIDQMILQQPEFQEDGKFSPQRFDMLVRGSGMTPVQYKAAMKQQLLVNQLLSGYAATEFVTDTDMELAARISAQQRDIEYALMTMDQALAEVVVEPAEVQAYYADHPDEFTNPEKVAVEYIQLRLQDFHPEIEESEVRAAYDASIGDADLTSRRRAAHILLDPADGVSDEQQREKLVAIATRITAGESFDDLAREYSDDLGSRDTGGDLGYTDGSAFPEEFEDVLANLEIAEVSDPVKTEAGWHLVKLLEVEKAEVADYASRRDEIREQLLLAKAEPQYAVKLEELKDVSFNAADLASVAKQLDLATSTSAPFSRSGEVQGLFADKRVVAEAFNSIVLEQGANSEVVEISPTEAVVLRVAERQPSTPIPLADVEADLGERLHREKATEYMVQRAKELLASVNGGQALAELAESKSLEYQQFTGISRENISDVPAEIAAAAFQLSPPVAGGENYAVRTLADGTVALVGVTKVAPGALVDLDTASQDSLKRLLARYRAERVVESYRASLQDSADIEML
jgi:peptidyl-prolyl cis-trans isomerase D